MSDYLSTLLSAHPHVPPHALWRAVEAELFEDLSFERPMLDLGCGDGSFSKILFGTGSPGIFGCDISDKSVAAAKLSGVYEDASVANASELPFPDSFFKCVFSNCVLEHIVDDISVVGEISRVLMDGGVMIFTVPSEYFVPNLGNQNAGYIKRINDSLEHFHYRSPDEWSALLNSKGLAIERASYFFPRDTQRVWETLLNISLKKMLGRELFQLMGSKKIGLGYVSNVISPLIFKRVLRKAYIDGATDDGAGGALLITARKRIQSQNN